ncbi:Tfp pilus assembly protein FimT/FimU [Photobacterium rosenbergii]|uniref:pilus assembly FimT family protein n=1 Tax=Photobacterium rosenbergii TaxID=294936 RepID=UPI0021BD318B|nr:prepilin-type N-terminal cleavage/methylation domain-containing protein [Photobacterium rosenbergii]
MKMWVSSKPQSGFSLIELLVVLALMSALVSFAVPNLWGFYNARVEQGEVDSVVSKINILRRDSRHRGVPLILNEADYSSEKYAILPDGWSIDRADQLRFLTNRVTNGGEIVLNSPSGKLWLIWFQPLDGNVKVSQYHAN